LEIGDPEGAIRAVNLELDRIIATMNHDEFIPDKMGKTNREKIVSGQNIEREGEIYFAFGARGDGGKGAGGETDRRFLGQRHGNRSRGSQRRRQNRKNVGVVKNNVQANRRHSSPISFACRGSGWQFGGPRPDRHARMPPLGKGKEYP